jgi:hypothetical protein
MSTPMTLPLDPTGKATTNDITGEQQAIGTNPVRIIALNYGAFWASSLVLKDAANGNTLTTSQYFTALVFDLPTAKYAAALNDTIVGLVIITDPTVSANVVVNYQALGGGYQTPLTGLANDVALYEPSTRPTNWPSVIDSLAATPASQALHDAGQAGMITFEYVVHALHRMTQMAIMGDPISQAAIQAYANAMENNQLSGLNAQLALLYQHEANYDNPHEVSAHQLGAYLEAEEQAAIAVEATNRTNADTQLTANLTSHETNYNNPHQLTLAQLSMYSVGQVNTNITSAQTAISSTITTNATVMNAHINNLNNPHQDSTSNLGTLTVSQIQTAIANATTPVSNSATSATTTLSAHMTNYNNPHQVTPAQIGTWTATALQTLLTSLSNHIANTANPHKVNISQIGGLTVNQFNAALSAAVTNATNYYNSNYSAIWNHINNRNNPHQVSAEYQLGGLGPWNLGQLESDLNNAQSSINASGYPVLEQSLYLQDSPTWSGSLTNDMYYSLPIFGGTQWYPNGEDGYTGCNSTTLGSGMPIANPHPGGGTILGFLRHYSWTMFVVQNGSLDGTTYTSTLGESATMSNNVAYSFNGNLTAYAVQTGVSNLGGGSRSFNVRFTGGSSAGQPAQGYIEPPMPKTCCSNTCKSFCCFVAGSKVLMADYSWKRVEEVTEGDMLMTPTGPARCRGLHEAVLTDQRQLLSFAEDPDTKWTASHPLWSRKKSDGKQWWWVHDVPYMLSEMTDGLTEGLYDLDTVIDGMRGNEEVEFAHLNGFVDRKVVVVENASPDTKAYIPILEGPPCIINGYVAAAFWNQENYDYDMLDWTKYHNVHKHAMATYKFG